MEHQELLALYDRELRIEIEYPEACKEVLPHVVRFVRPAPGMNFVLYSDLAGTDPDAAIREQIAYFRPMNQPFSWKVFTHDRPADLADRLVTHGFQPDDDPGAIMVLDLSEVPTTLLAPVTADIRPITSRNQLGDVITVMERVWGSDFGWMWKRLGDHLEIPGYLSISVAYVAGEPACAGRVYFYPGSQFAGLWGGSTVPEHRRRGLYTAVLAARIQEVIRRGRRYLTIDANPNSRPIVARHGFRLLTSATDYEWKGETTSDP